MKLENETGGVVEGLAVIGFVFGMMGIVALVRVEN